MIINSKRMDNCQGFWEGGHLNWSHSTGTWGPTILNISPSSIEEKLILIMCYAFTSPSKL